MAGTTTRYRHPKPGERLEPGTQVIRRHLPGKPAYGDLDPHHRGVVPFYGIELPEGGGWRPLPTNLGWFPVRWRDHSTETCLAHDVIVIETVGTTSEVNAA